MDGYPSQLDPFHFSDVTFYPDLELKRFNDGLDRLVAALMGDRKSFQEKSDIFIISLKCAFLPAKTDA